MRGNYWFAKAKLAFTEGDWASALEDYKECLQYQSNPNDRRTILNAIAEMGMNLEVQKAGKMEEMGDWDSAISHLNEAHRECVKGKKIGIQTSIFHFLDCDTWLVGTYADLGGKALSQQNWLDAARQFDQFFSSQLKMAKLDEFKISPIAYSAIQEANRALASGDLAAARLDYEKAQKSDGKQSLASSSYGPIISEIDRQIARQQQSNPNYPKPPPIYRDASTPRSYPDLTSYTPQQHAAHDANEEGNLWAQKGDWVEAMLSYQKALMQDPNGPFSKVIKENLDIARGHLGPAKPRAASSAAAPAPPAPGQQMKKPEEIANTSCTGWMTQTNGTLFHICADEKGHHYCEQGDGKGPASRVNCE